MHYFIWYSIFLNFFFLLSWYDRMLYLLVLSFFYRSSESCDHCGILVATEWRREEKKKKTEPKGSRSQNGRFTSKPHRCFENELGWVAKNVQSAIHHLEFDVRQYAWWWVTDCFTVEAAGPRNRSLNKSSGSWPTISKGQFFAREFHGTTDQIG